MIQIYLVELVPLLLGYTVKIFEIMGPWQRNILTQSLFWKELARQNGGMQSGHEAGTITIVIVPGILQNNLTKANAMGKQIVFSKYPPLPTFYFTGYISILEVILFWSIVNKKLPTSLSYHASF